MSEKESIFRALLHGKVYYNRLLNGEPISASWTDFKKSLVVYYSFEFGEIYMEWEKQYDCLTFGNFLMLIFQKLGYDDAKIARIMSTSEGAVRTARTRLKQKKK